MAWIFTFRPKLIGMNWVWSVSTWVLGFQFCAHCVYFVSNPKFGVLLWVTNSATLWLCHFQIWPTAKARTGCHHYIELASDTSNGRFVKMIHSAAFSISFDSKKPFAFDMGMWQIPCPLACRIDGLTDQSIVLCQGEHWLPPLDDILSDKQSCQNSWQGCHQKIWSAPWFGSTDFQLAYQQLIGNEQNESTYQAATTLKFYKGCMEVWWVSWMHEQEAWMAPV